MLVNLRCPGCQHALEIDESHAGRNVKCPICPQEFRFELSKGPRRRGRHALVRSGDGALLRPRRGFGLGWLSRAWISASTGLGAVVAAGLTVLFYVEAVPRMDNQRVIDVFTRGWVPYVIVAFTIWPAMVLVMKAFKVWRDGRILRLDLLPRTAPHGG